MTQSQHRREEMSVQHPTSKCTLWNALTRELMQAILKYSLQN